IERHRIDLKAFRARVLKTRVELVECARRLRLEVEDRGIEGERAFDALDRVRFRAGDEDQARCGYDPPASHPTKPWRRPAEDGMFCASMASRDALDAAHWLIDRVRKLAGSRWCQGSRSARIPSESYDPNVALIASERIWRVGELESRALVGWAEGIRE